MNDGSRFDAVVPVAALVTGSAPACAPAHACRLTSNGPATTHPALVQMLVLRVFVPPEHAAGRLPDQGRKPARSQQFADLSSAECKLREFARQEGPGGSILADPPDRVMSLRCRYSELVPESDSFGAGCEPFTPRLSVTTSHSPASLARASPPTIAPAFTSAKASGVPSR